MTQPFRLETGGGRITRGHAISFQFDGRHYTGYQGDTLASSLLANGVHLVGRSFKYHRPRGILAAGSEEPNALVTVRRDAQRATPNLRATQVELYDGLIAQSQNRFPSLAFDIGAAAGCVAPLLSAGFYYKTFLWPPSLWKRLYEPAIRAAAGLGRAPEEADPDRYAHQYTHCETLVIGGGPAGIAAALAAAEIGGRVMMCDEQAEIGGDLSQLQGRVTLLARTTAFGWYPDNLIGLCERVTDHQAAPDPDLPRERLWHVRARDVVLATGATERPLVFRNNDLPGVMLAGAVGAYANQYGVMVGRRVVVATNNDSAYVVALDLHRAGVTVVAILDSRISPDNDVIAAAQEAGIPIRSGTSVNQALGRQRIKAVKLAGGQGIIECDALAMSGGWTPNVHLFSQARGILRYDPDIGAFLPGDTVARVRCVGACSGEGLPAVTTEQAGADPRAFVDFQNDVTMKDLAIATQEGFRSIEHIKRYTTAGMATDQGKTSNINVLSASAQLLGRTIPDVGHTTFRPPYTPVTFGALAGAARGVLFDPVRQTPLHAWAAEHGAVFENVGPWKRARYFPVGTESMRDAVARECRAVRTGCGIFDASTLGKIEVTGPDAAEFLNRLYVNDISSLAVGRCRYAVLLGEDGFIRDDGIIARLGPDRFHVTTTTAAASWVLHHMEDYLQTEFTELRAWLTSTTEHWAVIGLQGPCSRAVLEQANIDTDLTTMAHMSVRECRIGGVPARLCRVSFTGEVGFEINVPASQARAVWDVLMAASNPTPYGPTPYGTEAMHVLRAEKGYIIIGQETDGTVIPADLGLPDGRNKRDFVGKRSLARSDMVRDDRLQLVGLLTHDPAMVLAEGEQLTQNGAFVGYVTSSYFSVSLGRSIALALVSGGRARSGQTLRTQTLSASGPVAVVASAFYDPAGTRLNAHVPLSRSQAGSALIRPNGDGITRLLVRAPPSAATSIGLALAVLLGSVPNRVVRGRGRAALRLGPDEWLVILSNDSAAYDRAIQAMRDGSVVDVTDRFISIDVTGPRAAWCINGFCALDLAPHMFPVGMCTRTLFGKAEIVLWRTAMETFHIETARSLAPCVRFCLDEAARGFHPQPNPC